MNLFLNWWVAATPEERTKLAAHCSTTVETLRQEAHAYRNNGILKLSIGRAQQVATGTRLLERDGLLALDRTKLHPFWEEHDKTAQLY